MAEKTQFEELLEKNVNEYTEKKNGLTYLSWVYAWKEFKKAYPNAQYIINFIPCSNRVLFNNHQSILTPDNNAANGLFGISSE